MSASQPLAASAGLRMLAKGGNAIDAALASAIALTVVEPTGNGVGSDAFAIVWDGATLHGLNASGRSPATWTRERFASHSKMPARGWNSVTVPGAVSAWVTLHDRFGSLPFEELFTPAIDYARDGFLVSPLIGQLWARTADKYRGQPGFNETFLPGGRAPLPGEIFRNPALARTLKSIATTHGESFYTGDLARKMVEHSDTFGGVLTMQDLASHKADWCGTMSARIGDVDVHEIPPNGQGIATLIAVAILEKLDVASYAPDSIESTHLQIEAMKVAFSDVEAFIGDPESMAFDATRLLAPEYIAQRASLIALETASEFVAGAPQHGGTVYLTAADANGMMVSYIQSNYEGFGSGVVVDGTGISMQNRGMGFSLDASHANVVGPCKRPFHTIIPGFAMQNGQPLMSFGLMGGPMQAQGHLQLVVRTQIYGQNPQAASDAPRWQVTRGRNVLVEAVMPESICAGLQARGHVIEREPPNAAFAFGGAQLILRTEDGYIAGSDHRKDGAAVGF